MRPSFDVTRDFLLWLYPYGPWTLTAISVSKKEIVSETCRTIEDSMRFVEEHGKFNLYYSVNEPVPQASNKKKFSKTDIARVHYLHVDVDPRAGEDIASEQTRILAQIQAYKTPPSCIIFSGGGYNALWKLDQPVELTAATPEEHIRNAIEVERRNWQFELDFATPDHCRDISRILRLPGTINWPSAEKVAKGRTPALAVIHDVRDITYPLSHFMATPSAPVNVSSSASARVTLDVRRVESIDTLEVPEKLKKVIVQGFDPDEPQSQKSRSEWLFFACCEMVRHNVPDEVIHGVITDSRFGISESVLDKGSGVTRYALRQISRAKDQAIHPRLLEMNDKFAVIENYGGRCVIMRESEDGQLTFQNPREFFAARASSHILGRDSKNREVTISDGKWWFGQPRRRQYERVVFDPSGDSPGAFNTFRGFRVQPAEGAKHASYLRHVFENICSGNQEHYDYLIQWMARVVQQPKTQSEVAIVLIGGRGTGKSFFCRVLLELFGSHGAVVDNMDHLIGRFNSHLADKLLVVAEEAYHAYDRRNESVLKEIITGKNRAIERKGYDVFWGANYVHLLMTSNNEKVVPAGDHERRFLVLKVGDAKTQNTEYFAAIDEDMKSGGYAHLMHFLLSVDLSKFNVRAVPKTTALVEQQMLNLSRELEWLMDKLHLGIWLTAQPKIRWEGPVIKSMLYADYVDYMRQRNHPYVMSARVWHDWFKKQMPSAQSTQLSEHHASEETAMRPRAFVFPPLSFCREEFSKARNWPGFQWDEPLVVPGIHDQPTVVDGTMLPDDSPQDKKEGEPF